MKRFSILIAIAVLAALPALALRAVAWQPGPIVETAIFGVAILAAGFLLSWGAEAAESHIAQGLILAAVALVTVLPEYAVDMYYAFQAGQAGPESPYVHYAAANMTGANRLLVGVAWPLLALLHWIKARHRAIELTNDNAVEISFLLLASIYAFVILVKGSITLFDFAMLVAIYGGYVWRVRNVLKSETTDEDEEPGPAAALNELPVRLQWMVMAGLGLVACAIILRSAEPFAEAMVDAGRALGINEFLLIQWLAPLASEAPAVSVAILFVLKGRASGGLVTMISDKINQWTLLVGMLPLAVSIGAGSASPLALDARQIEEFFLTASQSLFGVALLMRLRFSLLSAGALASLFAVQVGLAYYFKDDEPRLIATLTGLAWIYLALAAILFMRNRRRLLGIIRFTVRPSAASASSISRSGPA
ncbi:sodium:proton exchanger [Rhodopseudomonas boonkerdii]|uniref:sodium:proton exchanger n=1 Tax=Rhodopseudomonas boonkerdii TaxID=475937 RepID=UPI001E3359F4|nr:sodium:proton exchanger [Rhodopseudomonas boonkerdii]UGV24670.1 sodium:proton exchanger [Rhodopseudomonas boonkerdii]